jgi:lysophospholipase L1-like esterase
MLRKKSTYLFAFVALLIALELGLRLALGLGRPPLMQKDDNIGYLFQADQHRTRFGNEVTINAYHQRSEALSAKPDSTFLRVLFIGDSVTWGSVLIDQDETYPELFEQQAAQSCTQPVEALNASAGSWGIKNLRAYAERFGAFESDLVVLQIGSHDLFQDKSTSEVVGRSPAMPNEAPLLAVQELWVRYLWPRYLRPRLPAFLTPGSEQGAQKKKAPKAQRFAQNMTALRGLIGALRTEERPVAVLHTPDRREVVRPSSDERTTYRRRFVQMLDSLQAPVFNLQSRWAKRRGVTSLYRDGVHLNERGNAQLAEGLWAFVRRQWDVCSPAFLARAADGGAFGDRSSENGPRVVLER